MVVVNMASSFIQSFIKHILQVFHRPGHPVWCREFKDSQAVTSTLELTA